MAERSFPLENTNYTAEDAQLWLSTRETGVYSANGNLDVTAPGGMTVQISPGMAWLCWARFKGVAYANTQDLTLHIAQASGIQNRIDRVVVRFDQIENTVALAIKTGSPASNPVAPALERQEGVAYEIALADVRVSMGAIEITPGDITDQRLNESLCGIMSDGVTRIPTQMLYDQVTSQWAYFLDNRQTQFDTWFDSIRDILDENIAATLLDMINEVKQSIVPGGVIVMWSGTASNIPVGWRLCDGTNGTPNLRDRFIVGAGTTYTPGNTGGAASVALTTAQLPAHGHTFSSGAAASTGSHSHTWTLGSGTIQSGGIAGITRANPIINGAHGHLQFDGPTPAIYGAAHKFDTATTSAGAHTHTVTGTVANNGSGSTHENRPPYYALCFIMKT